MDQKQNAYEKKGKTFFRIVLLILLNLWTFDRFTDTSSMFFLFLLLIEIAVLIVLIYKLIKINEHNKEIALKRVETPEEIDNLYDLPELYRFQNKEEEEVNAQFQEFLTYKNLVYTRSNHLLYLLQMQEALHILRRQKEAAEFQLKIKEARQNLKNLKDHALPVYKSRYNDLLYGLTDVHTAYRAFASKIQSEAFFGIEEFFQDEYVTVTKTNSDTGMFFTPAYVLFCKSPSEGLRICRYSDLNSYVDFSAKKLDGPNRSNAEIHHMGFKYEKLDGTRDMRYSIVNNPPVPYVYDCNAFITLRGSTLPVHFPSRAATQDFKRLFDDYSNLMSETYKYLVEKLLSHDKRLDDYNDLSKYYVVLAEEELKNQLQREREIKEKADAYLRRRELERERQAEEARRAEADKAEKERREREKKEKAEADLRRQEQERKRRDEEALRKAEAEKAEKERRERERREAKELESKKQLEEARLQADKNKKELLKAQQEKEFEAKRSKEEIQKAKKLAEQETRKRTETERELSRMRELAAGEAMRREQMEQELRNIRAQADDLSGLSEEERAVVLEMRKKRLQSVNRKETSFSPKPAARKTQTVSRVPEKPIPEAPKKEYILQPYDNSKARLSLMDDKRRITNNIFSLVFVQDAAVSADLLPAEYEAFVTDSEGRVISNIKSISADKTGEDLTQKVSFSLSTQEKFDKQADYYVVLRYKGAGNKILSKTRYQINIAFASDFDDF